MRKSNFFLWAQHFDRSPHNCLVMRENQLEELFRLRQIDLLWAIRENCSIHTYTLCEYQIPTITALFRSI